MPYDFDIVCVGNAKIDTFLNLHQVNSHLRYAEETNELCIKFGEKITIDKADVLLGGNAANVSVGTSRLGLKTAIFAEIGKDEFAQKIINTLSRENVDISNITQTEGQQSSFSTIINFRGERTIFSEHVKRQHKFSFDNISTKWVYLTSLGEEWKDAYDKTAEFIKTRQCLLAFNPGTLQIKNGKENIKNILLATSIIFLNKEEGEDLLGYARGEKNTEDLIKELQELGPKVVVVTDGKNGSFAIDKEGNIHKKGIADTKVVEKTGAGDAYSSGFISALINNQSIVQAMDWGTKNATSVIGKVGATAGLLHREAFEKI